MDSINYRIETVQPIIENNKSKILEKYIQFQTATEIKSNFDLKYMAIGLAGEVGEVLNEIKKLERDDNNHLTGKRRESIKKELGDVMWYFTGICTRLNLTIEDVLLGNIEKLKNK